MTEEAQGSTSEETVDNSASSSTEQPDVGALVAESKKYRNRAQEAETKLAEYEKAQEAERIKKLEEDGKLTELNAELQTKYDQVSAKASEWDNYQSAKKDEILKGMTEEQQAKYSSLDLTTLESIATDLKINTDAGQMPTDRPGQSHKGAKFNGHESLPAWAAAASKGTAEERLAFKNRKGDYPG